MMKTEEQHMFEIGDAFDDVNIERTPTPTVDSDVNTIHSSIDEAHASAASMAIVPARLWSGFYKKSVAERRNHIGLIYPHLKHSVALDEGLSESMADNMVENCIGVMKMPLGLGLNTCVNGVRYSVPMAVEEPSIIAAVSSACKVLGDIRTTAPMRNVVIGQIHVVDVDDVTTAVRRLEDEHDAIVAAGNMFCQSMVERGGGVQRVEVRRLTHRPPKRSSQRHERCTNTVLNEFIVVHVFVDVCNAMGANCVSTVCEGIAPTIAKLTCGRVALRILSNLSVEHIVTACFAVPIERLGYRNMAGEDVCRRIIEANDLAWSDPFRASTHNKGIMNGVDSVLVATGQDWRAVEAATHAWTVHKHGFYAPLTDYWEEDGILHGQLEIPMPVGVKGGSIKANPTTQYALGILGHPSASTLASIITAVGLAQNFGALRALVTEGIQRGHMSLHARNIAVAAGAPQEAVAEAVAYMVRSGVYTLTKAREYLDANAIPHSESSAHIGVGAVDDVEPSGFFYEEARRLGDGMPPEEDEPMILNVAFKTVGDTPVYLEFDKDRENPLHARLFGTKGHSWMTKTLHALDAVGVHRERPRHNIKLAKRLKTLSILLNVISYRLLFLHRDATTRFLAAVFDRDPSSPLALSTRLDDHVSTQSDNNVKTNHRPRRLTESNIVDNVFEGNVLTTMLTLESPEELRVGFPLILSLWRVFRCQVEEWVSHPVLSRALLNEQQAILHAKTMAPPVSQLSNVGTTTADAGVRMRAFMASHAKFFQVTMVMFCDAVASSSPAPLLSPHGLHFLRYVGRVIEWEGAVLHDLARFERDVAVATASGSSIEAVSLHNSYLFWLNYLTPDGLPRVHSVKNAQLFFNFMTELNREERANVLAAPEWHQPNWGLAEPERFALVAHNMCAHYGLKGFLDE